MARWEHIFDSRVEFDPAGDLDLLLKTVPAKWVVYLFADAGDQPIQLLCVKNLRASLKRRLGGQEMLGPTRKVNYRELVRQIYYRRVDSAFEADLAYLEAAREVFPRSYRGMMGFEPAWFIHVNPEQRFPRYIKIIDLAKKDGVFIGPIQDKHAAARLIQLLEDAFDLCRYYNVLVQAPNGRPCAYKEMGKCPAPCEGAISMDQYRQMVRRSAEAAVDPGPWIQEQQQRMQDAAMALNFEAAAKIKQYIAQLSELGKGPFRFARRLEDFRYVSLQAGPYSGTAKVLVITPGRVEAVAGLLGEPARASELMRQILSNAAQPPDLTEQGVERIGIVSDHLFRARRGSGVFLPAGELEDRALAKAWRDLQKQKSPVEESEDEGVDKELEQVGEP